MADLAALPFRTVCIVTDEPGRVRAVGSGSRGGRMPRRRLAEKGRG